MASEAKSRGGRPWSFDREAAIETALRLFWRHGYEGVSIGDLTQAIGIAPPSLYAAFGSKAGLYREAIDRYERSFGPCDAATADAAGSLAEAIRLLLDNAADSVVHPARERGCPISSGMVACHPDHSALAREVADRRERMRDRIADALRPFAGEHDLSRLARYLTAVMQGMSIQARDGATRADLQDIVEETIAGIAARHGKAEI
ncbi:TetR/AcrR family transcriptional regulator [Phreatobacter sp. AB_2022a]|uniref:TetR/AcrR family transcriptional regulator n=1 Tax=Phreatobacter sp. AB_2022a TaxID=3003134 RepID=UPI0022870C82|nr:TetR/AcrR family transcriptional regulator [Phreatobacter sp. AB_2022a]MCZ0735646.1 TetR/AcrR family transcriptional regulator [Phreatobacter sp. AB_2022a]